MEQEKETVQIKSDMPDEILLAALKLFAKKGYFNTSLTDIATAANLTNLTALYRHFPNKQAIASKLYENILDSLNISVDEIRRRNQKASEQLHGIVDLFFKLADDAPYIMGFLLASNTNEFLPAQKNLLETPAFSKIIKIIQSGISAGEIRNIDPLLAYSYFFGIINATLRMALDGALDKNANAYLSQTWLIAWNVIAKKSACF